MPEWERRKVSYAMNVSAEFWEDQADLILSIAGARLVLDAWQKYGVRIAPEDIKADHYTEIYAGWAYETFWQQVKRILLLRPRPQRRPSIVVRVWAISK